MPRTSKNHVVVVAAASARVLGNSDGRQSLVFSAPAAGRYSISFGENAVLDGGITIHAVGIPFVITREQIGDLISAPISVIGSGAFSVGVLEISGS